MFLGSREQVRQVFREAEAELVARMQRICEDAKRARREEMPIPEDDLPAPDRAAPPSIPVK